MTWKPGDPVEQPARGSRLFPPEVSKARQKELMQRSRIANARAAAAFKERHWGDWVAIRTGVDAERGTLPGEPEPAEEQLHRYRRPHKASQ